MRVVKLGIISIIVFALLMYLMSLLLPSQVRISRAINITAKAEEIYPYVARASRWKSWNTITTDSINISVLKLEPGLIQTNWNYKNRNIISSFRLEESSGITVVQWYFDFDLNWYPWEKFGSITFDRQFGGPMEASLNNLKNLIENSP